MATDVTLDWADGEYNFRLTGAGCIELEQRTDLGIGAIWSYLRATDRPAASDLPLVAEIIRLGLEGGRGGAVDGKDVWPLPEITAPLIERYVTAPWPETAGSSWKLARVIVGAAVMGV